MDFKQFFFLNKKKTHAEREYKKIQVVFFRMEQKILTNPAGMVDLTDDQLFMRKDLLNTIKKHAYTYGVQEMDTPIMEHSSLLLSSGTNTDLLNQIFHMEKYALRYDLTKPFARFMAQNGLSQFARIQAGPVFRKDTPAIQNGRFSQFWQCDIDFAGKSQHMLYDWYCIELLMQVFNELALDIRIRINHRALFEYLVLAKCNVPREMYLETAQIIDKSDKLSQMELTAELLRIGLTVKQIEDLETYILDKDTLGDENPEDYDIYGCYDKHPACDEIATLFRYANKLYPSSHNILTFDKTLVRGMHYYTGVIFEVVLVHGKQYGSIAAGGRYDKLIGELTNNRLNVPVVGVSFGIDRILMILGKKRTAPKKIPVDIYITFAKNKETTTQTIELLVMEVLRIAKICRDAELTVHIAADPNIPLKAHIKLAGDSGNAFILLIGETELSTDTVMLRELNMQTPISRPVPVPRLVPVLRASLYGGGRPFMEY